MWSIDLMAKRTLASLIRNALAAGAYVAATSATSNGYAKSYGFHGEAVVQNSGCTNCRQVVGGQLPGYPMHTLPQTPYGYPDNTLLSPNTTFDSNSNTLGSAYSSNAISNYGQNVSGLSSGTAQLLAGGTDGNATASGSAGGYSNISGQFITGSDSPTFGGLQQSGGAAQESSSGAQSGSGFGSSNGRSSGAAEGSTAALAAIGQPNSTLVSGASVDADNDAAIGTDAAANSDLLQIAQAPAEGEVASESTDDSMPWSVLPSGSEFGTGGTFGSVAESNSNQGTGSGGGSSQGSSSGSPSGGQGWSPSQGGSSGGSGLGSSGGQQSSGSNGSVQTASLPPATSATPVEGTPATTTTGVVSSGETNSTPDSTSTPESTGESQTDGFGNGTLVSSSGTTSNTGNESNGSSGTNSSSNSGSGTDSESTSGSDSPTGDGLFTNTEEPCVNIPVTEPTDPVDEVNTTPTESDLVGDDNTSAPVVPEPSSMLMLAVGSVLGGAIYNRRRSKKNSEQKSEDAIE